MITFDDVSVGYDGVTVLGPVSGVIPAGGVTSIVGPNGAGKSTLLTAMGRLLTPDSGRITIDGLDVARTPSRELAKKVAILRQENTFTARLTVRQLVGFGRFPHSKGRLTTDDRLKIDEALSFVDLQPLSERFLDQLSGGQRQRAFVAMVLAQDTDYVLLDEPLNNLDMRHAVQMMGELRRAADELHRTIVLIIHDINFAAAYSDHVMAMRDGAIVSFGSAADFMNEESLTAVFETPVRVHSIDGRPTAVYYRP